MTASANTQNITVSGQQLTTDADGNLTLPIESATELITALLAARKAGYEAQRVARLEAKQTAKTARDAKRTEAKTAAAARKVEQLKKLEAKVAELKKATKANGRKAKAA